MNFWEFLDRNIYTLVVGAIIVIAILADVLK
jgi:hypothetical protein